MEEPSEAASVPPPVENALLTVPDDVASTLLVSQLNVPVPEVVDTAALDAAALLAQSTQWAPASSDNQAGGAEVLAQAASGLVAAGAVARPVPAQALSQMPQIPQGSAAGPATQTLHKLAAQRLEQAFHQSQAAAAQAGVSGAGIAIEVQAQQVFERREFAAFLPSSVETTQMATAAATRREERGQDHAIFKMHAVDPAFTPNAAPTGAATVSASGVSAPAPTAEVYAAEQVKYWISNDVQNAEMQLDGLGDGPVEVSISMQGNEAQVAFRTDEVRAREALENASAHLKEMLQREGLVLSGVSVGTADAGGAGTQERKGPGTTRQVVVAAGALKGENPQPVAARVSGRTLDLFV